MQLDEIECNTLVAASMIYISIMNSFVPVLTQLYYKKRIELRLVVNFQKLKI